MARMIPNSVSPDTPSQAEFDLFRDLDAALDDEFVVFHSMPWLASDHRVSRYFLRRVTSSSVNP